MESAEQTEEFEADAEYYIPEFMWNLWLEACPVDMENYTAFSNPRYVGLHVYDTYGNELSKGHNGRPFSQGVFSQIKQCMPNIGRHPIWETALAAFHSLEKDAEMAIRCLIQQTDIKSYSRAAQTRFYGLNRMTSRATSGRPKLSLSQHSFMSLLRYLIFLRFRNRESYHFLLKLAKQGYLFFDQWRCNVSNPTKPTEEAKPDGIVPDPLSDWISLLEGFKAYFIGNNNESRNSAFIWDYIHPNFDKIQEAEICIGIASDPDEYILTASCWGNVEEDGRGYPKDTFHYFFPITPHVIIYILLDAPLAITDNCIRSNHNFLTRAPVATDFDQDDEASIDVYQRNALMLQTFPHYVIFVSSRSMIRTITYYNERQWLPGNLDYSKLLRGCWEESVTHTLLVRSSIEVIDLTDDVSVVGDHAVSYGSFADVWKGVWVDRINRNERVVALKILRANLVGYVHEKLLKRLKQEVQAWYRLDHPNVSKLHGIMQLPNTLAMISPWCENGTVVRYLREVNPDANRMLILYEIASGVSYFHSREPAVIHGDLKGCNILIDADGHAVITDFGLAKVKEEVSDVTDVHSSICAGSLRWMAPELYKALLEDESRLLVSTYSDVYSFASVCFEILTGQVPYANRRSDAIVTLDILNGVKPYAGLNFVIDSRSKELWGLMDQCWDVDPHARPDMRIMSESLKHLQ